MALRVGARVGPYEITGRIGKGGMGIVYRARDHRLERDVAIKVMPPEFAGDVRWLRRFEAEARAVSALNHPGIVTVFDLGTEAGAPYLAMEVLDGRNLRVVLKEDGPMGSRRVAELGLQVAQALAVAHGKGIIHRDLKPDNLFVCKDGRIKVLDFGLAKMPAPVVTPDSGASPTVLATHAGMVVGTPGYMSPEQASGHAIDARSDLFSLGAILYEALCGQRAFPGDQVEAAFAAVKLDPADLPASVDRRLASVIARMLVKDPATRMDSAATAVRELERLNVSDVQGAPPPASRSLVWLAGVAGIAAGAAVAGVLLRTHASASPVVAPAAVPANKANEASEAPTIHRLTFHRGVVHGARFVPNERAAIYSARWDNGPAQMTRIAPTGEELAIPIRGDIAGVSVHGELAVLLGDGGPVVDQVPRTLARVANGMSPKRLRDHVTSADWAPDGGTLVAVILEDGKTTIEWPLGTPVYTAPRGWIDHLRVAPDGKHAAFVEHPLEHDSQGNVAIIDATGKVEHLEPHVFVSNGLAWAPDGKSVWFSMSQTGAGSAILEVAPGRPARRLFASTRELELLDVAADHRALIADHGAARWSILGRRSETAAEQQLAYLSWSFLTGMTAAGDTISFLEQTTPSQALENEEYVGFTRSLDGGPPTQIGPCIGISISPDGGSVALVRATELQLIPTAAGSPRTLPRGRIEGYDEIAPAWSRPGDHLVVLAHAKGEAPRLWVQAIASGDPSPVGDLAVQATTPHPLSPDGSRIALVNAQGNIAIARIDGAEPPLVLPQTDADIPLRWTGDQALEVGSRAAPLKIEHIDLPSGARTAVRTLADTDLAGDTYVSWFASFASGGGYVYGYLQVLTDLYELDDLR